MMNNTFEIFNQRKNEVNIYLKSLKYIDDLMSSKQEECINSNDTYNHNFIVISKSSFILILYNLVEASISSAISEIYTKIEKGKYKYNDVIDEIKTIWANNVMKEKGSKNKKYGELINIIINDIISFKGIKIKGTGNFTDENIRTIMKNHNIYHEAFPGSRLKEVTQKRNYLAHGIYSFIELGRDITINDLEKIEREVISFIETMLSHISNYYEKEGYLKKAKEDT